MAKINILYLITKATNGGAQKYVHDLAINLPKDEFDVIVAYGERGKLARTLAGDNIKLREIPSLRRDVVLWSDIASLFQLIRTFRELRPDIVHLNSSKAAALGACAARIAGIKKIIFTAHGWPFKEARSIFARVPIFFVSWLSALLSHAVIVVSRTDERLAGRMWGIRTKVHYIPLGLTPLSLAAPQEAYRAMFGSLPAAPLKSTTLRLLSIAELTANKGLRFAIEAVRRLRDRGLDVVYVIAGEGEERAKLEKLSRTYGLSEHVFLPGYIENAAANLLGFDVFVLPSLKEGTPYSLLEAAQAGISIVATDVVDDECLSHITNARRVPRKDPVALADAISELSKTPRMMSAPKNSSPLTDMLRDTYRLYR